MKVLLRDDDTCGMTRVEELQRCYSKIWDTVPVCLSVVPHIIPSGADWNAEEFVKRGVPVALEENEEIVAFLREGLKAKQLDVALHGYHHLVTERNTQVEGYDEARLRHRGREYLYGSDLEDKTRKGKIYLEQVLDYSINTFVPPGNAISEQGLRALVKNKLNLVGSPGLGARCAANRFDLLNYMNAIKRNVWKRRHNNYSRYPFVMDYAGGHKEVSYFTLYPGSDLDELKRDIDFVHNVDGIFVLGTHYHAFPFATKSGETVEYVLHAVLDYISGKAGVDYISYRELWN